MTTDTQSFPSVALPPLPTKLSPRTQRRSVRWTTSILLAALGIVAGLLLGAVIPLLAFFVPQPLLVAGIVVLVGVYVVARSMRDQAVAR